MVGEGWLYPHILPLSPQPEGGMVVGGSRGAKGSNSETRILIKDYE